MNFKELDINIKNKIEKIWKNNELKTVYFGEKYIAFHNGKNPQPVLGDKEIDVFCDLSFSACINSGNNEPFDAGIVEVSYDSAKALMKTYKILEKIIKNK